MRQRLYSDCAKKGAVMLQRLLTSAAVLFALGAVVGARAETLSEALSETYRSNPQLLSERAVVRATDEQVPQALSGWRPTVQATGSIGYQQITNQPASPISPNSSSVTKTADVNLTENVYRGGRTVALTAQAEDSVQAERARLIGAEQTVFFAVVTAYLDVIRDQATVELNINNEQVLRRQLEATSDQFRVGSVTRTDVAQAESRLALATASRIQSEGQREVSRAEYERAVGHLPGKLVQPDLRPVLPLGREEALHLAATKNPNVIAALFTENAARDAVVATRAQLLPSLDIVGDVAYSNSTIFPNQSTTNASVVARVTVPLYEGGNIYSQTRQAEQTVGQRMSDADDARRAAVQGATRAWETVRAARAQVLSLQATIRAAQIALEGVQ